MRTAKKHQATITIMYFGIVILFSIRSALAKEILSDRLTKTSPIEEFDDHQVIPTDNNSAEHQKPIEMIGDGDTHDDMDAVCPDALTPREVFSFDIYGLFLPEIYGLFTRAFGDEVC